MIILLSSLFLIIYLLNLELKFKVIIFTLYFPLRHVKHPIKDYYYWIEKYFRIVKGEIVFYTNKRIKNITLKLKKVHTYFFDDITAIPIIKSLNIINMVSSKLNQLYHSKIALLYYISIQFKANIYFYNDISTFHFQPLETSKYYPNPIYIKWLFNKIDYPILFTINPNKTHTDFIQGGCFGGKKKAIENLYNVYYKYLQDYYHKHGMVIKTDEMLLDIMVDKINGAVLVPNNLDNCSLYYGRNNWFYYITVLSGYPKRCVKHLTLKHLKDF